MLSAGLLSFVHKREAWQISGCFSTGDVAHLIDFRCASWHSVAPEGVEVVKALANTDPALRPTADAALVSFKWLADFETLADDAPLSDDVLCRLRKLRVDGVQALALRLAATSGARGASASYSSFATATDSLFESLDADATGMLRRAELVHAAEASGLGANDLDVAFDNADLDGTGVVSKDELRAALLCSHHELLESLLVVAFERMDVSKTGTISKQDIVDAAKSVGIKRLDIKDVGAWIAAHDEAGDGVLSFCEFKNMMERVTE